ncbi:hypothetical protein N473_05360 [Pseudoalteromonas luteoviolacea CPMOR-1]|uniref:Methyltransferase domain-containing protein n=1 Tax=Pseudoalteromonas luteoviolacea CPMOR-1 TaxID=1365248 RepID=A0A167HIE7_9GAMM|nr:class I SAM-dependent methyltransferase [Pseudoalteromonas luteoviolacea]KZN58170.1 hypothetical protein N473_05360 [Pseudoalteromonas luteoviolacea CPMOR-1]
MGAYDNLDIAFSGCITSKALMLAEHIGLFEHLDDNDRVSEHLLKEVYKDKGSYLDAILNSLCEGGIFSAQQEQYQLLVSREKIKKKVPIFKLWLYAYRDLLSEQERMFDGELDRIPYDGGSVAKHSAEIGSSFIDKQLDQVVAELDLTGTLCDMGCGAGLRLIKLCRNFGLKGIGMDMDANAVALANQNLAKSGVDGVEFKQQDITKIEGQHEDIEAIMFTFFTHHIEPNERLERLLSNYREIFPNLKYIVIFDTVTGEKPNEINNIFSKGFDYIHRLQGLIPRTRADYMSIFDNSRLSITKEIPLAVDNSYVWICKVA